MLRTAYKEISSMWTIIFRLTKNRLSLQFTNTKNKKGLCLGGHKPCSETELEKTLNVSSIVDVFLPCANQLFSVRPRGNRG